MRAKRPLFPVIGSGLCFLLIATSVIIDLIDGPQSTRGLVLNILNLVCGASAVVIIGIATRSRKRQDPTAAKAKKNQGPPHDNTAGPGAN